MQNRSKKNCRSMHGRGGSGGGCFLDFRRICREEGQSGWHVEKAAA